MKDFIQGLKNLKFWLSIIWKDRDFDHYYFFKILSAKLSRMEDCIRNGIFVSSEETANKLLIAKECCERLIKEEYFDDLEFDENEIGYAKQREDLEVLTRIIREESLSWWN